MTTEPSLVIRVAFAELSPPSACFYPIPPMMCRHRVSDRGGRSLRKSIDRIAEKLIRFGKAAERYEDVSWFNMGVEAIRVRLPQPRPLIQGA